MCLTKRDYDRINAFLMLVQLGTRKVVSAGSSPVASTSYIK
jgi:hypothetical protein